jgi:hypothetical protein
MISFMCPRPNSPGHYTKSNATIHFPVVGNYGEKLHEPNCLCGCKGNAFDFYRKPQSSQPRATGQTLVDKPLVFSLFIAVQQKISALTSQHRNIKDYAL